MTDNLNALSIDFSIEEANPIYSISMLSLSLSFFGSFAPYLWLVATTVVIECSGFCYRGPPRVGIFVAQWRWQSSPFFFSGCASGDAWPIYPSRLQIVTRPHLKPTVCYTPKLSDFRLRWVRFSNTDTFFFFLLCSAQIG